MKKKKYLVKNYMTMDYSFAGVRIHDGFLVPVDWTMQLNIVAPTKTGKSKEDADYTAGFAYQKIYFWLDTNLPNVVMVDVNKEDDLYLANLSSNIMLYCPGPAGDDLIVQLLHSKISTLAGDDLIIGEINLKGSDSSLKYTFDSTDGYSLPTLTKDYYTGGVSKDENAWWIRNDGFCFEFIRPEDTEVSDEELFGGIQDPLDEFEKLMQENQDTGVNTVKEPARIIQVDKWKPRKVE